MSKILKIFFTLFFCLSSSVVWSLEYKDLVKRDNLYYKQFSDVPFSGKITGQVQCSFKNGMKEGLWIEYHKNGQLNKKVYYKKNKRDGEWLEYNQDGKLISQGWYENGLKVTDWIQYNSNSTVYTYYFNGVKDGLFELFDNKNKLRYRGIYEWGEKQGIWYRYYPNGKVQEAGHYRKGKKDGYWEVNNKDGTLNSKLSGTFKNGKKISD